MEQGHWNRFDGGCWCPFWLRCQTSSADIRLLYVIANATLMKEGLIAD